MASKDFNLTVKFFAKNVTVKKDGKDITTPEYKPDFTVVKGSENPGLIDAVVTAFTSGIRTQGFYDAVTGETGLALTDEKKNKDDLLILSKADGKELIAITRETLRTWSKIGAEFHRVESENAVIVTARDEMVKFFTINTTTSSKKDAQKVYATI